MRLLFITQKIDKNDDVLGVYHHWIEELAKKIEKVNVICLSRGRVELPANVRVYSLGKESLKILNVWLRRAIYIFRFYRYIWNLRQEYDVVLAHMNPEYILIGGWLWKIFGKQIFLWYNHPLGSVGVRLAAKFCRKIFHTSPFAYAIRLSNAQIMPAGIDTEMFRRDPVIQRSRDSILYLGRISKVKNLDVLVAAAKILKEQGTNFNLKIVGSPVRPEDIDYEGKIQTLAQDSREAIEFSPAVPNQETAKIYNSYELVINLTDTGSLDKAMLEAMACESLVLVSNRALENVLPPEFIFKEKDSRDLADKIKFLLGLSSIEREEYGKRFRDYVVQNHDLKILINKLLEIIDYRP